MMYSKNLYIITFNAIALLCMYSSSFAQNPQDIDRYLADYANAKNSNNSSELAAVSNKLGYAYWGKPDYDKAIKYFEEAIGYNQTIGNKNGVAIANNSLGGIFSEKGEHSKALPFLKETLSLREEMRDRKGISQAYLNIGVTCFDLKKHDDAVSNLETAVTKGQESGASYVVTDAYDYLSKCYQILGDAEKALEYQRLFMESSQVEGQVVIDDLEKQRGALSAQNIEQQLVLEQRDEEVEALKIQKQLVEQRAKAQKSEIARLRTEEQLKDAQIKKNEAELRERKIRERYDLIIIAFLSSGVVMLSVIVFILRRAQSQRKNANETIQKLKNLIADKDIEIAQQQDEIQNLKSNQTTP